MQKYSNDELLAESVLIDGLPFFLVWKNGKIIVQDHIGLEDKILKPLEPLSYVNKPYSFSSLAEVDAYINKVNKDTLDSLYRKVKSIWNKYIDADDSHISICAADTIFTYLQDKIGLTHYLFFVGNPASGKSNNLTVFQHLAYRNMTSSDMSHSNIYQFLGNMDEGVGTLCEDEADNIDEYPDKMRIYKNGYTTGRPILKTDTTYGRKQYRFNTFCFKAFAAERLPDSVKAKGFNQRIIEIPCVYGFPTYDISEIINPAGEREYIQLFEELMETRNSLLILRLQRFGEKMPDIKTNLQNREKQLFKSLLRIFHNTSVLDEILPVISKYVSQKREANANTLYALLYHLIKDHIRKEDSYDIESKLIWETITDPEILPGEFIPNKKLTYDSVEFGQISQKAVIEICKDVFGATKSKRHGSARKLLFDKRKLDRLAKIYELDLEIKVKENGTDETDGTHVGLDKHLIQESNTTGTAVNDEQIIENCKTKTDILENITSEGAAKESSAAENPSQVSQVSQTKVAMKELSAESESYNYNNENEAGNTEPVSKPVLVTCPKCGTNDNPYWMKFHNCEIEP